MSSFHNILIGYASGIAAGNPGCGDAAPYLFKKLDLIQKAKLLYAIEKENQANPDKYAIVAELCTRLSEETAKCIQHEKFFTVMGGDHSCAIGTWSGAAHALRDKGDLGLIWIDAHLDAHMPHTTPSGNIHGMPVAVLLGYDHLLLTQIQDNLPKIKPENLCIIGVRSYEPEEQNLVRQLNIRVFYMEEIINRGLDEVFAEARQIVTRHTAAYGVSLDIDGIDPIEAPAVGTPEKNGIAADDLCAALKKYCTPDKKTKKLIGWEIAEFNPHLDIESKTEQLILKLLKIL
jgi:arginase